MGVPRFFRWLSERYPLTLHPITSSVAVPQFDNLYLDMNGIIHNCTHGNADDIIALSEKDQMMAIFRYVDEIFNLIRPQRVFYMAIDGLNPSGCPHTFRRRTPRQNEPTAPAPLQSR